MTVRTRFAPSPTGQIHVGNIRTAIFNWLFARHEKGEFLLRLEDTDAARSTKEACEAVLEAMEWLGLDFDGDPLYQSSRRDQHLQAAKKLILEGSAYQKPDGSVWFRIPMSDVPEIWDAGETEIKVSWARITDEGFQLGTGEEPAEIPLAAARDMKMYSADKKKIFDMSEPSDGLELPHVFESARYVRYTRRVMEYADLVKGRLEKPLESMKDFALVRAGGTPVFHLANVLDDIWQGITHVIRGDDHVDNTFKHILIFRAMNAAPPAYAHLPMIVNPEGKPYSKRDGAAYIGDFKGAGFVPDAMINSLALLGWSPKGPELMTRRELIDSFDLSRCHKSPARMDTAKMKKFNGRHISMMDPEAFAEAVRPYASMRGWDGEEKLFRAVCLLMQSRTKTLDGLDDWEGFFTNPSHLYDKAVLEKEVRPFRKALKDFKEAVMWYSGFGKEILTLAVHKAEQDNGLKAWALNQPLRYALTGSLTGADIIGVLLVLGPVKTSERLDELEEAWSR